MNQLMQQPFLSIFVMPWTTRKVTYGGYQKRVFIISIYFGDFFSFDAFNLSALHHCCLLFSIPVSSSSHYF